MIGGDWRVAKLGGDELFDVQGHTGAAVMTLIRHVYQEPSFRRVR